MCRLFGIISQDALNPTFYLKEAAHSLLWQSDVDKKRRQSDGWGLAWFESGRPKVFKSAKAIYKDERGVRNALQRASGRTLLGHIRWASNPLKLPRHELIGVNHSQPFSHGPWSFVHNGTLLIPREVKEALGPWKQWVKGKNDSEVLFYWLLKTIVQKPGSWQTKLRASLRQLDRIWQGCKNRYPIYKHPYHGLNWVLTNGKTFLAFCCVNPRGFDKGKSLGNRRQPYYQLQLKKSTRSVIVASEPLDQAGGWVPFRHGSLLVIQKTAGKLRTEFRQVL